MSKKTFRILSVSLLALIVLLLTHVLEFLAGFALALGWQGWLAVLIVVLIGRAIYSASKKEPATPNG